VQHLRLSTIAKVLRQQVEADREFIDHPTIRGHRHDVMLTLARAIVEESEAGVAGFDSRMFMDAAGFPRYAITDKV
jgi:hypothetical protein